jgi:hypothetical protein
MVLTKMTVGSWNAGIEQALFRSNPIEVILCIASEPTAQRALRRFAAMPENTSPAKLITPLYLAGHLYASAA